MEHDSRWTTWVTFCFKRKTWLGSEIWNCVKCSGRQQWPQISGIASDRCTEKFTVVRLPLPFWNTFRNGLSLSGIRGKSNWNVQPTGFAFAQKHPGADMWHCDGRRRISREHWCLPHILAAQLGPWVLAPKPGSSSCLGQERTRMSPASLRPLGFRGLGAASSQGEGKAHSVPVPQDLCTVSVVLLMVFP